MRKFLFLALFVLMGCASVQIPAYLQAEKPYAQRFFVGHDQALGAIKASLEDLGWEIEGTVDPSVYEQQKAEDPAESKTLVMTKIRQTPVFLGTRYARLNLFLKSKKDVSEIEIRYLTVSAFFFKTFRTYRNDSEAARIFERIDVELNGQ